MRVTHENGRFALRASWAEIIDACGGLDNSDIRDGFLHLSSVAAQNTDEVGIGLIGNALGTFEELPAEVRSSLAALFVEAMAVGKEITLRKLARAIDPHGEFLDVPAEWIGKGPG